MSISGTKVLYLVAMLLILLFMYFSQRNNRKFNIWNLCTICVLGLLVGFRYQSVGYDTHAYYAINSVLKNYPISEAYNMYGVDEYGYLWISFLLVRLFHSAQAPFVFWGLFTNLLIVLRLHELKDKISMPIAMMSFFALFYFAEFNIMREMIAVAIIFYGSRWLEKKQYVKFGCTCILASTIHLTALISLSFIPFTILLNWPRLTYRQRGANVLFLGATIAAMALVLFKFVGQYGHYLTPELLSAEIGLAVPLKIVLFFVLWFSSSRTNTLQKECIDLDWRYFFKASALFYLIGLGGYFLSYFVAYTDRATMYFHIFELVCYGVWYKQFKRNDLYKLAIIAMIIPPLLLSLVSQTPGGQGQYPYIPFWNY